MPISRPIPFGSAKARYVLNLKNYIVPEYYPDFKCKTSSCCRADGLPPDKPGALKAMHAFAGWFARESGSVHEHCGEALRFLMQDSRSYDIII